MKKYTTLILVGIIVLLAAVLVGVLVFMNNQPPQERAFEPLVEIEPMEPDSEQWGINFPNQWTTFRRPKQTTLIPHMPAPPHSRGWNGTRAR